MKSEIEVIRIGHEAVPSKLDDSPEFRASLRLMTAPAISRLVFEVGWRGVPLEREIPKNYESIAAITEQFDAMYQYATNIDHKATSLTFPFKGKRLTRAEESMECEVGALGEVRLPVYYGQSVVAAGLALIGPGPSEADIHYVMAENGLAYIWGDGTNTGSHILESSWERLCLDNIIDPPQEDFVIEYAQIGPQQIEALTRFLIER